MINCYNLIGKQILSLPSGQIIGIVKNIEIKNMRLTRLFAFNDNSDIEEEFLINVKDIYSFGENAITLKKEDVVIDETFLNAKIVGANVFNQDGVKLDSINDVLVDEKTFKVVEFLGEKRKYSSTEIYSINNGVIVLKGQAKVTKTKSINKIKVTSTENTVTTLQNTAQDKQNLNTITLANNIVVDKSMVLNQKENLKDNAKTLLSSPKKTLANYSFLVGRVISTDVYANNGTKILTLGEIVSNKTVLKAFENNFLKSLIENSKPV